MHLFRFNDSLTHSCHFDLKLLSNDMRLLIVGMFGSSLSIVSVVENVILFYVFSTSQKLRRQNYANPVLLSFFDILVSLGYLCTVSLHFFAVRLHSVELIVFWSKHMRIGYCIQHFALTVSNFLLVVASLERYLANGPFYTQKRALVFMVRNKIFVIIIILILAFLFKATLYFENTVLLLPNCEPILRYVPIWTSSNRQASVRFWLRNIFTIIAPFFVLAYCNFYIVMRLRSRHRHYKNNQMVAQFHSKTLLSNSKRNCHIVKCQNCSTVYTNHVCLKNCRKNKKLHYLPQNQNLLSNYKKNVGSYCTEANWNTKIDNTSKCSLPQPLISALTALLPQSSPNKPNDFKNEKRGVRIATRTLVMVVGCYLISNSMTTVINIWEYFNPHFLRYKNFGAYFIASDLAVLLTICGCALRLPIYVINDRRIHNAIFRALIRFRYYYRRNAFQNFAADNFDFEKWSIIIVSNSLRSNITGMLSQVDFANFQGKKSFDQLGIIVQNRRRFLVQMTINLGTFQELPNGKETEGIFEDDERTIMSNLHDDEDFNKSSSDYASNFETIDYKKQQNNYENLSTVQQSRLNTVLERWDVNV